MFKFCTFLTCIFFSSMVFAQNDADQGWHLKDRRTDGYFGISLEKAYNFLHEKGIKPVTIIIGVLDTRIDTAH